jgi:hypothetical protein
MVLVVDNGGWYYLNQADIETMDVLKDAASRYGARAAAGASLLPKKGKSGK